MASALWAMAGMDRPDNKAKVRTALVKRRFLMFIWMSLLVIASMPEPGGTVVCSGVASALGPLCAATL